MGTSSLQEIDLEAFTSYDPVPEDGIERMVEIARSGRNFRYSDKDPSKSEALLLEQDLARYLGMEYALGLNSCTSALQLALIACGAVEGSQVLVPGFTFAAVPSAIVIQRAIPVFVECTDDYRMDIDDFRRKITPETKILLLSHMRGHICDMSAVEDICHEHDITLIEDAAHALGARWQGKKVGTFGKVGCFSGQSNKILNGGEGGMLVTDDQELFVKTIYLSGAYEENCRKHGIESPYFEKWKHLLPLHNIRMSNLTAAAMRPQIALIEEKAVHFRSLYHYLKERLTQGNRIEFPEEHRHEERIPDSIQFRIRDFDEVKMLHFIRRVKHKGITLTALGSSDNARHFESWRYVGSTPSLPKTKEALAAAFDMRLSSALERRHLDYFIATVREAIRAADEH